MLEAGTKAPLFTLPDQTGAMVSLSDFTSKKVILYFYPKDNTPGCTKQACSFRDIYSQLEEAGVQVLGVSKDTVYVPTKGLPKSKACLSPCFRTRSWPPLPPTMFGRKKSCTARFPWG